eukprot:Skav211289  [mRNA]  locus=scaffold2429:182536:190399:+ [translate_table: standard]
MFAGALRALRALRPRSEATEKLQGTAVFATTPPDSPKRTPGAAENTSSSRASEAASFRNPYVDPDVSTRHETQCSREDMRAVQVAVRQPEEAKAKEAAEDDGTSTDAKWKGLLARVEALAEFCRADESVALLPDCLIELKLRDELQTRCPQKMYKIAIQKLFSMGDSAAAESTWKRARSLFRGSTRAFPEMLPEDEAAIPWPSSLETPTVWVRSLTRQPFWDCHKAWPFVRQLESQVGRILSEAVLAAPKLEKDSYLHSLEHPPGSEERLSLVPWQRCKAPAPVRHLVLRSERTEVVRVLHPEYEMPSLRDAKATEAEGALREWSEAGALRRELSRLRDHYRKTHDRSASSKQSTSL